MIKLKQTRKNCRMRIWSVYFDNGALVVIMLLASLEAADEGAAHLVGHVGR